MGKVISNQNLTNNETEFINKITILKSIYFVYLSSTSYN